MREIRQQLGKEKTKKQDIIAQIHENMIINREQGIIKSKGPGFHFPSLFAKECLFYAIWSDEYVCNKNYVVKREYLDALSVVQILKGKMQVEYRGQKCVLQKGQFAVLDFHDPHSYRSLSDHLEQRQFLFSGNVSRAYYSYIYDRKGFVFDTNGSKELVLDRLNMELKSPGSNDHVISSLFHRLFSGLLTESEETQSDTVAKAVAYIENNFEKKITVEELADCASMSRYHFSRIFKEETGYSPHEYVTQYRINMAKELLCETKISVEEVAGRVGSVNYSYFVRAFKNVTGYTPARFRNTFNLSGDQRQKI